jgi:hypothetical protein
MGFRTGALKPESAANCIANYVEITSAPLASAPKSRYFPEGRVELVMGTMSSGQGHETSFAQLVTEWLGVPAHFSPTEAGAGRASNTSRPADSDGKIRRSNNPSRPADSVSP